MASVENRMKLLRVELSELKDKQEKIGLKDVRYNPFLVWMKRFIEILKDKKNLNDDNIKSMKTLFKHYDELFKKIKCNDENRQGCSSVENIIKKIKLQLSRSDQLNLKLAQGNDNTRHSEGVLYPSNINKITEYLGVGGKNRNTKSKRTKSKRSLRKKYKKNNSKRSKTFKMKKC